MNNNVLLLVLPVTQISQKGNLLLRWLWVSRNIVYLIVPLIVH